MSLTLNAVEHTCSEKPQCWKAPFGTLYGDGTIAWAIEVDTDTEMPVRGCPWCMTELPVTADDAIQRMTEMVADEGRAWWTRAWRWRHGR